jgi:hypothetical protein
VATVVGVGAATLLAATVVLLTVTAGGGGGDGGGGGLLANNNTTGGLPVPESLRFACLHLLGFARLCIIFANPFPFLG